VGNQSLPQMSLAFASLGSGSKGNATLVRCQQTQILIDCGFSIKETEKRLERLETCAENLAAILVTHEHGDHISGVGPLARKYKLPVFLSYGTMQSGRPGELPHVELISGDEPFTIGDIAVHPYPVPHDAREPVQFVFSNGQQRFAILTDTGHITPHIIRMLDGCDGLFLECNHDVEMLTNGSYPQQLKQRVGGQFGHLNNQQSADLLRQIDCTRLQHLVAAHISDKNNTVEYAQEALAEVFACLPNEIKIADQEKGLTWHSLN